MPPKTPKQVNADATEAKSIIALCHLIMSCQNFKADTSKLAPILGINHAKNVPRSINSIISPHGFEFKGGKVTMKGAAPDDDTVASTSAAGAGTIHDESSDTASTAATKKAAASGKARKPLPSKKRKLADSDLDDQEGGAA
ncbi:hypothetical protein DL766_000587 [Monosporascus sp. MC13-8B]|uniref:Uncharacterized protein n=1 Tax=Monosporascus cannonballus TaxID=155416 RepID=A0ABY0GQF9_9PEZI|nr:hypothetical protein DL762_010367 [Monosporascus cannonballus]RYO86972.1 hypothetical protein DL763_006519 [Monosporascus cannonballus]RYP39131.1 hypothetical protein DL766_000587 [Monosporascus sp. MC13-8B]